MGCVSRKSVTKLFATISSIPSRWALCRSMYSVHMFLKDWSCAPWTVVGLIFGAMLVGVPFGQLCWWALYKLRMWFSGRWGSARFSKESVEPVRTTRDVHRTQHVDVMWSLNTTWISLWIYIFLTVYPVLCYVITNHIDESKRVLSVSLTSSWQN